MKNFSLNIKSGSKGNLLATLLVVTASLLFSASAWAATVSVYTTGSATPDLWAWKTSDSKVNYTGGEWPGVEMTETDVDGWYQYTIENGSDNYSVVFSVLKDETRYQTTSLETGAATDACGWFHNKPTSTQSDNGGLYTLSHIKLYGSNWGNWGTEISFDGWSSDKLAVYYTEEDLPAGTYTFRVKWSDDWQNHTVSTTRGNCSTITKDGDNGKIVLTEPSDVTFYFDPGTKELFVDTAFAPTTVPTVFNAKAPVTEAGSYEATLSGYLKYTGCETILENGFIYSTDIDDMKTDIPTGDKTYNTLSVEMEQAELFQKTSTYENGTYYYRSYVKYNDGSTDYYVYSPKSDIGSFIVNGECSSESTITVSINKESAVLSSTAAEATLTATANKALYQWECTTKPDGATVTFTSGNTKTTDVNVSAAGNYVFQLKGRCSDSEAWKTSTNTVSLHVCVAPTVQQLYLDEAVSNIICSGEKSTATIISQTGYDYTLRSEAKTFGTLKGSGATLTWRNVDGTGTFTVIASETGTGQCESQMTAATQTLSAANIVIDASSLTVNAYQPVTLSVNTTKSHIDANPVWQITAGTSGYMLEPDTRMQYDGEHERASVEFKGGATAQTTYSVKATADYTTVLTTGNKVCEATATVNIEVSPATESCD